MKNKRARLKTSHYNFFSKNHKGLSAVITTLIMVALVIAAIAIVWVAVTNLLTSRLNTAGSCLAVLDKVEINELYTCYESSLSYFNFSISIKDIDVDEVIVSVSGDGTTKSYTLNNTAYAIPNLANYSFADFGAGLIKLPEKNSGLSYVTNAFVSTPDSIKIMPVIGSTQCETSDVVTEIYSC